MRFFSLCKKTGCFYFLLGGILWFAVDGKVPFKQHLRYNGARFYKFAYQSYPDGVLYFDQLTLRDPKHAQHYANMGTCYFKLGDLKQAMHAYRKAMKLEPENGEYRKQWLLILEEFKSR